MITEEPVKRMTRQEFNESMKNNPLWKFIDTTPPEEDEGDDYETHMRFECRQEIFI